MFGLVAALVFALTAMPAATSGVPNDKPSDVLLPRPQTPLPPPANKDDVANHLQMFIERMQWAAFALVAIDLTADRVRVYAKEAAPPELVAEAERVRGTTDVAFVRSLFSSEEILAESRRIATQFREGEFALYSVGAMSDGNGIQVSPVNPALVNEDGAKRLIAALHTEFPVSVTLGRGILQPASN